MTIKASSSAFVGSGSALAEPLPSASLEIRTNEFTPPSVPASLNRPNAGYSADATAANNNGNASNHTVALNGLAQQLAFAQQGTQASGAFIAAQLLQQISTPEGRANLQQMGIKITPDGRIIPNARVGVAHIYLKNIDSMSPTNLPDLDGRLWSDFSQRLLPIRRQIKKILYSFVAYGILSTVLCAVTTFVLHPFAIGGVMAFTFACFLCIAFVSKKKWMVMNEEVKEICMEYGPKFDLKGHSLEYYDSIGMIVVSRKEDAV